MLIKKHLTSTGPSNKSSVYVCVYAGIGMILVCSRWQPWDAEASRRKLSTCSVERYRTHTCVCIDLAVILAGLWCTLKIWRIATFNMN